MSEPKPPIKIKPTREAYEWFERQYPATTDAEKYRLAQAKTMLDDPSVLKAEGPALRSGIFARKRVTPPARELLRRGREHLEREGSDD